MLDNETWRSVRSVMLEFQDNESRRRLGQDGRSLEKNVSEREIPERLSAVKFERWGVRD